MYSETKRIFQLSCKQNSNLHSNKRGNPASFTSILPGFVLKAIASHSLKSMLTKQSILKTYYHNLNKKGKNKMRNLRQKKESLNRILPFLIILLIYNFMNLKSGNSQVLREWVQQYSRSGNIHDNPLYVGVDRNGNIICVNNPNPGNNSDVDILKYNQAGSNLWIRPFNGIQDKNDYAEMFHIDDSSNVYFGGSRNQSSGGQATDPYLIKYNTIGTLQWDISFNSIFEYGHTKSMLTDALGNITVLGYWGGFTPNIDAVIKKLTPGGSQIWSNTWVIPGQREDANCLAKDSSGNIYVSGGNNVPSQTNIFLKKHSSDGTLLWSVLFNGPQNKADYVWTGGMALDTQGNIYLIGLVNIDNMWADFGNSDIVLLKYNSSGVLQWSRYISGSANTTDYQGGIAVDRQNNVYITGNCQNAVTGYDGLLAKYNTNGDSVWTKRNNGGANIDDGFSEPVLDKLGNVYVGGHQRNPKLDGIICKYDSSGILAWSQTYNGTSDSTDYFRTPAIDSSGNVFCIGGSYYPGFDIDMVLVKYLQPPYNPENLNATAVSGSRIDLSWADVAGNETGFKIERSTNGGANWNLRDSTNANTTSYIDTGLTANSIYHYRIYGYNAAGTSLYSNLVFDTTFNLTPYNLQLSVFIEGFYRSLTNSIVPDSMKVCLRSASPPYAIVDSANAYLSSSGAGTFSFSNISNGVPYYIQLKHRNSIETWSGNGETFVSNTLEYDFTTASSKAYGSNMIGVDASPVKFGIYGGDINQEGNVDLSDVLLVYNDASSFVTGYVKTDVNGDNIADLSDVIITYNNSSNFVVREIP